MEIIPASCFKPHAQDATTTSEDRFQLCVALQIKVATILSVFLKEVNDVNGRVL